MEHTRNLYRVMLSESPRINDYAAWMPLANVNTKIVNDEDEFMPDSTSWHRNARAKFSLYEFFLAFIYMKFLFENPSGAQGVLQLFRENGARLSKDARTCAKLLEQWRETIQRARTALQVAEDALGELETNCDQIARSVLPARQAVGGFLARAYHPDGPLAQRLYEPGNAALQSHSGF